MLTWIMFELAKDQAYQSKLRDEIAAVRAKVTARGDDDFTVADLDSMTFVIACMKVGQDSDPRLMIDSLYL